MSVQASVPRVALRPQECAAAIGVSRDFFDVHIAPDLRWVRRGRLKLCAVSESQRFMDANASLTLTDDRGVGR